MINTGILQTVCYYRVQADIANSRTFNPLVPGSNPGGVTT